MEQVRVKVQQKSFQAVDDLLVREQNSTFPDIVSQALALARQAYLARVSPDLQLGSQYNALNAPDKSLPSCEAALKANPSGMQFLAASALVSGVWFALHLLRWIWRWIVSIWAQGRQLDSLQD